MWVPVVLRALHRKVKRLSGKRQCLPSRSLESGWEDDMLPVLTQASHVSTAVYVWFRSNRH